MCLGGIRRCSWALITSGIIVKRNRLASSAILLLVLIDSVLCSGGINLSLRPGSVLRLSFGIRL